MSEFATLRPALIAIAQTITGLATVEWLEQKRPFTNPATGAIALLSFGPTIGVGRDEIRSEYDGDNDGAEFTDTAVGVRRLPWRIRVDSYEQQDDLTAWTYLENARLRLRWPSVVDALIAANVALVETRDVQDLQVPEDEHVVSRASLDIILAGMFSETDPVANTYIASITGLATFTPNDPLPYEVPEP